ncbi:MAG: DegV family protein [Bacillota bacterium]|nr:DegV family protein [Bacillota bacterium]
MTKKKIAWITDSTAYMTQDLLNNPDVYVVPLDIIFGNEAFKDGIDLNTEELYSRIRKEKEIPKTSQPSSGMFAELFNKLKLEYDGAIAIHISSKFSGTLSTCKGASEMTDFPVETIDSKSMGYAITSLLNMGIEMAGKEMPRIEIASRLREEVENLENYVLLGSLDQFYKGGRMSGTQFLLGSILQIKPIIRMNRNGEFELFEKIRSEKKAIKRLLELFDENYQQYHISELQILHGNVPEKAKELENTVKKMYPNLHIVIAEISSTIAAHSGEGTFAIQFHKEQKK